MSKGVIPTYDEIRRDLLAGAITKERAIKLAQQRKRLDDLSANLDLAGEWGRQILGAGVTAAGAIPIFGSPGVGGAVGGGLAGLGSGIQHHHSGKQLAKDVGIGAIGGATTGALMGMAGGTVANRVAPNIIKNASKGVNKVTQNIPRIPQSTPVKNFNQRLAQNKINTKPDEISVEEFLNSQPKYETKIMKNYSPDKIEKPITNINKREAVNIEKGNTSKVERPVVTQSPKPNTPEIKKYEYHASPTQGIKTIEPRSSSTDWGAFTTQVPDYSLQSYGNVGGSLYKVEVPNISRLINELQPLKNQSPHIQAFNQRLFETNPDLFLPVESALGEDVTGRLANVIANKAHPSYYGLTPDQWESKILGRYLRRNGIEGVVNPEFTEAHYFNKLPVVQEIPITQEMMDNINIDNITKAIEQGWKF